MLQVVADENIPQIADALAGIADVTLMPGRSISRSDLLKCDALLVRSITKVNRDLLSGTPVRFAGSATIGTDHLDLGYFDNEGIAWTNAAGCNANSVVEFIIAALLEIVAKEGSSLRGKKMGIAGKGNIGRPLSKILPLLGIEVLCCDPPLEKSGEPGPWSSHDEVLQTCDFVTWHVPLERDGDHPTLHMVGERELSLMKSNSWIINACRGPVVDNAALLETLETDGIAGAVLDVWENEPSINRDLLKKIFIATPHIAGYSQEGKLTGTEMIVRALCKHHNIDHEWSPTFTEPGQPIIKPNPELSGETFLHDAVRQSWSIFDDDQRLRETLNLSVEEAAIRFDYLRKNYPVRREFRAFSFDPSNLGTEQISLLENAGFRKLSS